MTPAEKIASKKPKSTKGDPRGARKWKCLVREYREKLSLTHRDVCTAIGMSTGFLVGVERGFDVRLTTAALLADFFGTTIQTLWPERIKS